MQRDGRVARATKRRLVVPLVLALTTIAAACGDDAPVPSDARAGDAPVDTPII
jgi:hypothetical protein